MVEPECHYIPKIAMINRPAVKIAVILLKTKDANAICLLVIYHHLSFLFVLRLKKE
jgi:hypothetical protein